MFELLPNLRDQIFVLVNVAVKVRDLSRNNPETVLANFLRNFRGNEGGAKCGWSKTLIRSYLDRVHHSPHIRVPVEVSPVY